MNDLAKTIARLGLVAIVILAGSGCGGGGSSSGGGGSGASNSRTESNSSGSTTIEVTNLELRADGGEDSFTKFRVTLKTPSGAPVVAGVSLTAGSGLVIVDPPGGTGQTDANGVLQGMIQGVGGGAFQLQAQPSRSTGLPAVTINILVFGTPVATATATEGTNGPGPTATPTVVPVVDVARLIVQANPFVIKSAIGGDITISVLAFDENNLGVPGVRLLLNADPGAGITFDPITPITNSAGIASATMRVQPGAEVGDIVVTAFAGTITGSTPVKVVSGVSERPVATVVLESDQPVIGTDSGGTASLKARVFDADNIGIPDVNVLFTSEIGQVTPPVEISCGILNPCPPTDVGLAQTTLTVPPNAVVREYRLTAQAGGVTGATSISIVSGRGGTGTGNPNAAAGEPASITLGASPLAIQVTGTGGTEQATVITRIFDNNNNPLSAHVVALRVVPDSANGAQMLPLSGEQPPLPAKCLEDPARKQAFENGKMALGISDRAGFVLASVRAGTLKGTVTVEACADSPNADGKTVSTVVSRQAVVTVAAGPPAIVSVAMNNVFIDNNDGTLLTTVAALVKDANGNTVEDNTAVDFSIQNRQDVSINGGSTTNNLPTCDISQFPAQTGIPVTAQPGTSITCLTYPEAQAGTVVRLRAESAGVTNEDNTVQDEDFNLPPGSTTGPANGVPSAHSFSLASEFLNLSGRVTFGLESTITAFVGDRAGNPVKRTTSVTFSTDGGGITSQALTNLLGRGTATLTTQAPIPSDGLVTVTASTQGEEDYVDVNGNGQYDDGVDTFDASFDQDDNGVWSANTEIRTQIGLIFSAPTRIDVEPTTFDLNPGDVQCFDVTVMDRSGNPIVGGSTVRAQVTSGLTILGAQILGVPDSNLPCSVAPGACHFGYCVFASDQPTDPTTVGVSFSVDSNNLGGGGNGNVTTSAVGTSLPPPTPAP